MSNGSEVEVVEETPAPPSRPTTSAIPKRKGRLPPGSTQASLEPQSASSSRKAKAPTSNGTISNAAKVDQAELEALRAENEFLRKELERTIEVASKFQEDFNKLQNLRFSKPEAALSDYISAAEERDRLQHEQTQVLMTQLPRLSEFLQPHSSGTLTLLTREETDHRLNTQRADIQNLRKVMDEQDKEIEELKQSANSMKLQLDEEIKRSTKLSAQATERQPTARSTANSGDNSQYQLKAALYEELTNIKIHTAKRYESEDIGKVTEFKCDCTTFGKTLFFKLELYSVPPAEDADTDKTINTVRYTPLGLENEKDQAFLEGLDYLKDTFTFIKDGGTLDKQMWEFGASVNNLMRAWHEGEEVEEVEEEGEEEADEEEVEVISEDGK
ncbi:hypothetical protein FRC07_012132 [Ceratobasidium sp. 392]|nr:hypothetical protein FRC07_012132 [Ceratobasidium sp. 392]